MLDESSLREFYGHVYPVELITTWISYNFAGDLSTLAASGGAAQKNEPLVKEEPEDNAGVGAAATAADGYLARREFCFTLMGDIFTRFRSYGSPAELRRELVRQFPEKIDIGAVYNIRPNQKQGVENVFPVERELVFDIDMSDYDNVRSCCTGKSICTYCWAWMSCAAHVLRTLLTEDFGFKYIMPVFSGRRGIHLWVCDKRARQMPNDERAALVGYFTVVAPKTLRSTVIGDLANHRPIHPSIRHVLRQHMADSFVQLFIESDPANPNNIRYHAKPAFIVYEATIAVLKQGRRDALERFQNKIHFEKGNVLDWAAFCEALGRPQDAEDVLQAVQLLLMYPRLDEHVSTRRDHLLKLPFCVHPGTASLCCPLEWDEVSSFNPTDDAPKLQAMILDRHMDDKWKAPLVDMLKNMKVDPDEA